MSVTKNIWEFITDPKNTRMFLLAAIVVLAILLFRQCEATRRANNEITVIENNILAANDTIKNWVDKEGRSRAEIRALILKLEDIKDSLKYEKNKPPITIIKWKTNISEHIDNVPVVDVDTVYENYSSYFDIGIFNKWGNSSRSLRIYVPYEVKDNVFTHGDADIDLEQNIWLSASIVRNKKTKEVFVNLMSDYPGTSFNSAQGILIDPNSSGLSDIIYDERKTLSVGLQLGVGYYGKGIGPYVGIGVNYSPKFLQW